MSTHLTIPASLAYPPVPRSRAPGWDGMHWITSPNLEPHHVPTAQLFIHRRLTDVALLLRAAGPAPLVGNSLIGAWTWTLFGGICTETFQHRRNHTLFVASDQEVVEKIKRPAQCPALKAFTKWLKLCSGKMTKFTAPSPCLKARANKYPFCPVQSGTRQVVDLPNCVPGCMFWPADTGRLTRGFKTHRITSEG